MHMGVLPTCMSVRCMYAWCPGRPWKHHPGAGTQTEHCLQPHPCSFVPVFTFFQRRFQVSQAGLLRNSRGWPRTLDSLASNPKCWVSGIQSIVECRAQGFLSALQGFYQLNPTFKLVFVCFVCLRQGFSV